MGGSSAAPVSLALSGTVACPSTAPSRWLSALSRRASAAPRRLLPRKVLTSTAAPARARPAGARHRCSTCSAYWRNAAFTAAAAMYLKLRLNFG